MKSKKQVWLGSDSRKDRLEVRLEEEKMPAGTPRQEADGEKLLFFQNTGRQSERKAESTEAGQWPTLIPRSSRGPKINRQRLEHRHSQQVEGSDYSFLCGTCGVTPGVFWVSQDKRDADKWWGSSRDPPRWLGLDRVTYGGAEGVLFVQHREQKAESISLLLSAPLGVKFAGRAEPDSSQRCQAKG